MEPSEAVLGGSFSPVEAILGRHGTILGPLGAILGRFGGMLGHVGGLDGLLGPSWSLWRAQGKCNGRPGTPKSRADSCHTTLPGGGGGPVEDYKILTRTPLGILSRLNVPGGTVADKITTSKEACHLAQSEALRESPKDVAAVAEALPQAGSECGAVQGWRQNDEETDQSMKQFRE